MSADFGNLKRELDNARRHAATLRDDRLSDAMVAEVSGRLVTALDGVRRLIESAEHDYQRERRRRRALED